MNQNLWKMKAIRLCFWMFFFSSVLIPFFTKWAGLKLSQVFLLNAWFMFWNFILEVPTGTIADRFGRKVSLILGSLFGGAAALLYASRPVFAVFLASEVLFAIAFTLHSGADEALAYDSLVALNREGYAKKMFASMESFKLSGIIVATIAGGWIAARFGYAAPMRAYAIPAAAGALICLTLKEAPHQKGEGDKLPYVALLREGAKYFAGHKTLILLTLELAITNALAWAIIWLFQPALERGGLAVKYYGFVHAAACLGQIAFLSRVDFFENTLGSKRRVLTASALTAAAAFLVLGVSTGTIAPSLNNLAVTIPAVVLVFTFGISRPPVFSAYMNKFIPSEKRATVLSFVSMCRTLGIVIVSPCVGLLADLSLSITFFVLGAALTAVTLFSRIEEIHLKD